jgi:hypothetical protein
MLISISMMMKDQRIIRITMLIISIMVKEMMIQEERRVSSCSNKDRCIADLVEEANNGGGGGDD